MKLIERLCWAFFGICVLIEVRWAILYGVGILGWTKTSTDPLYLDIGKTLIGSFVGAGLAFASNMVAQRRSIMRENLASGFRALFTIRSQLDDFANYRYGVYRTISDFNNQVANAPEWLLARPIVFNFNASNVFDYKSLAFLLPDPAGRRAFVRLQLAERTYLGLVALQSEYIASAQEIQRTMAPLHKQNENATMSEIAEHLGPELLARMRDQLRGVVLRLDRDEARYQKAFTVLNDVMREMFGNDYAAPIMEIPEKYAQSSLPALPNVLRVYVDSISIEID